MHLAKGVANLIQQGNQPSIRILQKIQRQRVEHIAQHAREGQQGNAGNRGGNLLLNRYLPHPGGQAGAIVTVGGGTMIAGIEAKGGEGLLL